MGSLLCRRVWPWIRLGKRLLRTTDAEDLPDGENSACSTQDQSTFWIGSHTAGGISRRGRTENCRV